MATALAMGTILVPAMLERGYPRHFALGVVGASGNPGQANYAAAKAGVDALTHGLAQEVAERGIRVNGVAPGIIRTHIHAAAGDRLAVSVGRLGFLAGELLAELLRVLVELGG